MRRLLARLVPDGLAARFTLLLACALIAANLVALVVLSFERERIGREARQDREIERIVGLVPALETVAPPVRRVIARESSTRAARVRIDREPLVGATRIDAGSRDLAVRLREVLGARTVHVGISDRGRDRGERGRRWQEIIVVSIELATPGAATWLNVTTRGGRARPRRDAGRGFLIILALSLAAVLGVGLWFARRLTLPLIGLADAARAAGRGDRTARVPEEGAREMREAAVAFNAMQGRITGFEAERMRTLAAVGHDLRTPITSLRIRAEMLDDDLRDPMVRTLDEMTVMADGLVSYARGTGEGEAVEVLGLAPLVERLCADRGAVFEGEGGADPVVAARPVALGRALGNLIDNAIRYGGVARVTVGMAGADARVTVDDDGPGIPAERREAMFQPFVRGDDSRSLETGGSGLGLAIARAIVLAHSGTIELANRVEGGLRVTVTLPTRSAGLDIGA